MDEIVKVQKISEPYGTQPQNIPQGSVIRKMKRFRIAAIKQ